MKTLCYTLSKSMQHASEVSESRCCCSSYPAVQNVFFSQVYLIDDINDINDVNE